MASFTVYRTSAFTDALEGGNEAGVLLNSAPLDDEMMQSIAREIGYSETAFIQKIEDKAIHVRYFTPQSEVPLCGHASIALLNLLRHEGRIRPGDHMLHTPAGTFPVKVSKDKATLLFPAPRIMKTHDRGIIGGMLFLSETILSPLPVVTIDAGVRELYVGLHSDHVLRALEVKREALLKVSEYADVSGVVFFATNTEDSLAKVRNFLPRIGIEEESATGTAAAALSKLLYTYKGRFTGGTIRQGESLKKPSRIDVSIQEEDAVIKTIEISGKFRVIDTVDVTL